MHESPTGRRAARALTAVSCAALLAACGAADPGPERAGGAPPADGSTAVAGPRAPDGGNRAGGSGPPGGDDRSAAWPGAADDRAVLARRRVTVPRPDDAPASVRPTADLLIRGLTVRGRVATLRFTAVVRGWGRARAATGGAPTLYDINPGAGSDHVTAQLIDAENLRRHTPLEDSEGEGLARMTYAGKAGDGQPIDASWMFAAPPAGVDAMDVQVGSWPVFREVPVTRR